MRASPQRVVLAVVVALCGLVLVAAFANKARCTGPGFDQHGVSQPSLAQRQNHDVCYSDIQYLWGARGLDAHLPPYLHGKLDANGEPAGGSLEYPALTGMLIWFGSIFTTNDAGFLLISALLLAPFGLFTAYALGRLTRWRALLWALSPPLVLYGFHNWDLAAVAVSTGGFLMLLHGRGSLERRALPAAALFGIGFALKLYPAMFVIPLLFLLGAHGYRAALWRTTAVAALPAVLANLPFVLFGYEGWRASIAFQAMRKVDITTDSLWFWAFRPISEPSNAAFQQAVGIASPIAILAGFGLALWLGRRRYRAEGRYPFVAVCAAMLCAFLLLHKVHSPQYVLWLLPFFALLRVRAGWIVAYLLADLALGIGLFRWYADLDAGLDVGITGGFAAQAVVIGVWGRAVLLAGLFFAFLAARPGWHGDRVESSPAPARAGPQRGHEQGGHGE